jgi:chromosome segregation protein
MADVTLVLDNGDGLLPVDFTVLELGRRLYRSGENDYLLNKQRIRLRDLVDLLDAAHLPTTPSCYRPGDGRPGARPPAEDAGRCSRRSPASVATSGGAGSPRSSWSSRRPNLARVEDILAELRRRCGGWRRRPSSRRRGRTAGDELGGGRSSLPPSVPLAEAAALGGNRRGAGRAGATRGDRAMSELQAAEEAAAAIAAELGERAAAERERWRRTRPRGGA